MRLSDVQHQSRAVSILRRALGSGRWHHAYLFDGPEGVGKELTATALAARLLCEDTSLADDADACGRCRSCGLVAAGTHPDYHLIHRGLHKLHPERTIRAGKGLFLVVDIIRHFLIEPASNSPTLGRRRVFIVRDAERMNDGAQNALLKTLEEPPGNTCLILVTSSAGRLLPTIRSRAQRIEFDLLPAAFVRGRLEAAGVAAHDAEALAALSQGRLGAALLWSRIGVLNALGTLDRLLAGAVYDEPEPFAKAILEIATDLATAQLAAEGEEESADAEQSPRRGKAAPKAIETHELRSGVKLALRMLAAILRDALVARSANNLRALPAALGAPEALAARWDDDHLTDCIRGVSTAEWMLDRNVAPQLTCERLATALSGQAALL